MKQHFTLVLVAILVVGIILLSGCGDTGTYSKDEVVYSFIDISSQKTLDENGMMKYAWSPAVMFASVKYVKDKDYYEIEWPCEPDNPYSSCVEQWGIDMETSTIWPLNASALMWAIVLFCKGKDDPSLDCQLWIHLLKEMVPK
jgi:hypothetical protein